MSGREGERKDLLKKVKKENKSYTGKIITFFVLLSLAIGICGLVIAIVAFTRNPKTGETGISGINGTDATLMPCAYCNSTGENNTLYIDGSILFGTGQQQLGIYKTGVFIEVDGLNGSWAANQDFVYHYTVIGNLVNILVSTIGRALALESSYIKTTVPLLDFLRPPNAHKPQLVIRVYNGSSESFGMVIIMDSGHLWIGFGANWAPFPSGVDTGFTGFQLSYVIA